MKKILSILTIVALVATLCVPAFAAPSLPSNGENRFQNGDSAQDAEIPVYGYIGEDADITDPEPGDPTEPPVPLPAEINVSVPVKLIWAAFESKAGVIDAPDYFIENRSEANSVKVTLSDFETVSDTGLVNADLVLNMTTSGKFGTHDHLLVNEGATLSFDQEVGTLDSHEKGDFTLTGTYGGSFDTAKTPSYKMTLTFELPA